MMKMIFYVQIAAIMIVMLQSCHECDEGANCHCTVEIFNNSNSDIWLGETGSQRDRITCQNVLGRISSNSSQKIESTLHGCWENLINNVYEGAVVFYIFDSNQNMINCDSVTLNQHVIERREYSVEELNALNWTLEYP